MIRDNDCCRDGIETDGGTGERTPRASKVGPRRIPGPYFFDGPVKQLMEPDNDDLRVRGRGSHLHRCLNWHRCRHHTSFSRPPLRQGTSSHLAAFGVAPPAPCSTDLWAHAIVLKSTVNAVLSGEDVPIRLRFNSRIDRARSKMTLLAPMARSSLLRPRPSLPPTA